MLHPGDRPELRNWRVVWPVTIICGTAMLARLMYHAVQFDNWSNPQYSGFADATFGLVVSMGIALIAGFFVLARVPPGRIRTRAQIASAIALVLLLGLSLVDGLEVIVPVITVLSVPVVRALRLIVLLPPGRQLAGWIVMPLSFVGVPALLGVLMRGVALPNPTGALILFFGLVAAVTGVIGVAVIGPVWRQRPWPSILLEFLTAQALTIMSYWLVSSAISAS